MEVHLEEMMKTLRGQNGKRNTIFMQGESNCGKSLMAKFLTSHLEDWQIGYFMQLDSAKSTYFEPLLSKDGLEREVYIGEEVRIHPNNVDSLKLLFEGSRSLRSDRKFKGQVQVPARPVIVTTNTSPWYLCPGEATPILNRCVYIRLIRPVPDDIGSILYKDNVVCRSMMQEMMADGWRL